MSENIHRGHRDRLKKQILSADITEALPHEKLLEMLLFYGIPQKDTAGVAHDLLETFGSLSGVLEADIDDIVKIKGMTRNAACLIKLMRPMGRAYVLSKFKTPEVLKNHEEIGDYILTQYFSVNNENFSILCLNRLGKVIAFETVMQGSIDSVGVSPRMIVEKVIKHDATAVVIAHNHPGGIAIPSPQDIEITKQIAEVLKSISVSLVDHIIIADNDYISLATSSEFCNIFK